jgi:Zn-dependent alcohol dehydrogenase
MSSAHSVTAEAALLLHQPGKWELVEVEFDRPRQGELLISMAAAGLCHSDAHMTSGELPLPKLPVVGGHEGAGVVEEVGPDTPGWKVGDHVVVCFVPACGDLSVVRIRRPEPV